MVVHAYAKIFTNALFTRSKKLIHSPKQRLCAQNGVVNPSTPTKSTVISRGSPSLMLFTAAAGFHPDRHMRRFTCSSRSGVIGSAPRPPRVNSITVAAQPALRAGLPGDVHYASEYQGDVVVAAGFVG